MVSGYKQYRWNCVPAFYMDYSEDSLSFMAGVLGGATLVKKNAKTYARYTGQAAKYIEEWKIPVAEKKPHRVLISPIWAAIFTPYMPESIRDMWLNIEKPYEARLYATLLWKSYCNDKFPKNGIPYLPSRRAIFYKYKSDEGAMRKLEMLRVTKNVVELDTRIGEMVQKWRDK